MKKNLIWNILLGVVLTLQLVAEFITAAVILQLNMLPDKFAALLVAGLVMLGGLTAILMFLRFRKPVGTARRIIACILALLIVCGCALVSMLAMDAYEAMNAVTTTPQTTDAKNMYVFVRMDDPATQVEQTGDYRYAVVQDYDEENTQLLIQSVEEKIGKTLAVTPYATILELAAGLFNDQADALVMNGSSVALLLEEEGYEDFLEKARIIYQIPLSQLEAMKPTEETTVPTTEPEVEKTVTTAPFVMYVSGSDTRSSKLQVSRSDVNILVVVNPVTKQVLLLNTPRDYYIPNPEGNGKLDKLTHCGNFGVDCSMEALSGLYGVEVDYYSQINFKGFETLIDAVGGITIYSDQSFTARDTKIKKGENTLNGTQALDLARERYHVSGGDNGRGKNQMKVIKALIEKMTDGTTIISNYSDILKSLEGMFRTSLTSDEISSLVKMQLEDMAQWNIQSFAVTGSGSYEITYSWPGQNLYVMKPNEDTVAYASQLINRVLEGETLTSDDMKMPG